MQLHSSVLLLSLLSSTWVPIHTVQSEPAIDDRMIIGYVVDK